MQYCYDLQSHVRHMHGERDPHIDFFLFFLLEELNLTQIRVQKELMMTTQVGRKKVGEKLTHSWELKLVA